MKRFVICQSLLCADAGMGRFVPPTFMGFAGQLSKVQLQGGTRAHAATITLVARRSLRRAGTRQWRRGADLQAAVANFAESEQLVVIDGGKVQASYVQVCWLVAGLDPAGLLSALPRPAQLFSPARHAVTFPGLT